MNALDRAHDLADDALLARLDALAGRERESTAELVAHLAVLDGRPSLYAARGYGSLFAYCTQALRLSEDATCSRIEAARACRCFPVILDGLASGALTLTSVRLLRPHLTAENHLDVIERACGRSRREIEVLIAHLAPKPDALTVVRRVPAAPVSTLAAPITEAAADRAPVLPTSPAIGTAAPPPVIRPTAPQRYRVQFTIGEATHERLRRLQSLLRREIPDGDPAAIFDRAVVLLLADVERRKVGSVKRPPIRPGTDRKPAPPKTDGTRDVRPPALEVALGVRTPPPASRGVPRAVRRAVWKRDGGQCAYLATSGLRCSERAFLEYHHVRAYARGGPATIDNIALRCRRHNLYEAELVFGPRPKRMAPVASALSTESWPSSV